MDEVGAIRRYKSRFMKDSLANRGSILWNLVNYNDKTTNVSFKKFRKRLTARDYLSKTLYLMVQQSLHRDTESAAMCTWQHRELRYK